MVIRESVEPLLEEYRPPGISSLKFSKLSLGNVAPKIEGTNPQRFLSSFLFLFAQSWLLN
jgi:Ca2+-dependent lipid-binding protein